jgi:hypothetical protein
MAFWQIRQFQSGAIMFKSNKPKPDEVVVELTTEEVNLAIEAFEGTNNTHLDAYKKLITLRNNITAARKAVIKLNNSGV